jgi:hypothetical protein
MDYVIEVMTKIVEKLREMSPTWDEFKKGLTDSVISPKSSR